MPWCMDTSQLGCPLVWEDSDDEAITHEKTHQGQVVSASAREILQGGDAVVGVVGGDTPDGANFSARRTALAMNDLTSMPAFRS